MFLWRVGTLELISFIWSNENEILQVSLRKFRLIELKIMVADN